MAKGDRKLNGSSRTAGAVALAVSVTVDTTLPVALIAVIADPAGADLGFGPAVVGVLAAVYWAASSAVSLTARRLVVRMAPSTTMVLTGALALVSLTGSALISPDWQWLALWAALGGAANALGHPSSNTWLQKRVPQRRRAFAFGAKQAAVPVASVVTGASLPLLVGTFGWRWAFAPAIVVSAAVLVAAVVLGRRASTAPVASRVTTAPRVPAAARKYLLLIAATTFFAAAHANSMGVFAVTGAIQRGLGNGTAGVLLVAASVFAVVVRTAAGVLADRGIGGSLVTVAALLVLGAAGLAAMCSTVPAVFVAGALVAFTGSFGWPGLVHYVVARSMGPWTATGTLITQTGSYLGSTAGPILFGLAFDRFGNGLPWLGMAASAAGAAILAAIAASRENEAVASLDREFATSG